MRAVSSVSCTLNRVSNKVRSWGQTSVWREDMLERVRRRRMDCGMSACYR